MKFYVLSRDILAAKPEEQFSLYDDIEVEREQEAWDIIEEEIATTNSQDWLLTKEEFLALKKVLE